jgi:hypothetical protein
VLCYVGMISNHLTLHGSSILDVVFAHARLLWLYQRHEMLGRSNDFVVLCKWMGRQDFPEWFLIGFGVFFVIDQRGLRFLVIAKFALDERFQAVVGVGDRRTSGIFDTCARPCCQGA